jgi:membrane associated rhomboid family serine protease
MIPIRDNLPGRHFPIITYLLIAANSLVFIYMASLSAGALNAFVDKFSLIPARISAGAAFYSLFTYMFLHGSLGHIFGNMVFLRIFGDNLEDTLGKVKYLLFYFGAGFGAAVLQTLIGPQVTVPNLGASGAIAGILGGYLVLFPRAKVDLLVPLGFFLEIFTVPAWTILFLWIVLQFVAGFGELALPDAASVAYFAHIGGFLTGTAIILARKKFTASVMPQRQLSLPAV